MPLEGPSTPPPRPPGAGYELVDPRAPRRLMQAEPLKARLETEVQAAIEETEAARRDHVTEVKALHEKHTVQSRRVAWAFSCARSIKDEKTRSVLGDLQNLQKRFDARES